MAGIEATGKSVTAGTIALRNGTELEEFRACVALQKEVWGFADNELVPLRIFSLAPKIGGQVIGAWDGETLVGFAFSIPGTRSGHPYLHSHMLAVRGGSPQYRIGPPHQTVSARRRHCARLRIVGVDLRSAGDQERLLQLERWGPSRGATTSTSTELPRRRCRAFFPPIAWSPSGG